MKILALDMSSTKIGLCYDGKQFETIVLKGDDIAVRCREAYRLIVGWVVVLRDIDLVVIESPVIFSKRPNSVIPQARVSGAVLAALDKEGLAWIELKPSEGKKALTGKGTAKKHQMIAAAPDGCDEHQADAYGLWKAAQDVRVEVSE